MAEVYRKRKYVIERIDYTDGSSTLKCNNLGFEVSHLIKELEEALILTKSIANKWKANFKDKVVKSDTLDEVESLELNLRNDTMVEIEKALDKAIDLEFENIKTLLS